ncbi:TPA: hypothetical protein N0F65_008023, partial [Lagenidium giganteum]
MAWVVRLDETHVHSTANGTADQRRDDWDPEVSAVQREHLEAPTSEKSEETRSEVTGWVDRVAGVHAERHTNANNKQCHSTWRRVWASGLVQLVTDRKDASQQQCRPEHFGQERRRVGHVRVWVRGEHALRGIAVWVDDVEQWVVDEVDHERTAERTEDLSKHVCRHLAP